MRHPANLHYSFEPLSSDAEFDVVTFKLTEALSAPFTLELELVSDADDVDFGKLLDKPALTTLEDRRLIDDADFILAVRADLPPPTLRRLFLQKAKVTSLETLNDLVHKQLPGIALHPLPVAPRDLPFHTGFSYFDPAWACMNTANGFGIHIAGEFPGLELQFWAIRSE
jgi:predicted component of type VI protein secretion system